MKMDDEKLKRILKEGMEYEADCIMAEVNSDPNVQDVIAPEDLHTNLMKQIQEHEAEVERERQNQAKEEEELIRLGKIYKKKRARRKYIILIAAVVCALAVGTISFGDGKKVFTEIQRMLGDRKQSVVNTDDGGGSVVDEIASEAEAYEKIEEQFRFVPVKMFYLPDEMEFKEANLETNLQIARLYYNDSDERSVIYYISTNHREASMSMDVEDKFVQESEKETNGTIIQMKEYLIEESQEHKWVIDFSYGNARYSIVAIGFDEVEVDEIINNLYFS